MRSVYSSERVDARNKYLVISLHNPIGISVASILLSSSRIDHSQSFRNYTNMRPVFALECKVTLHFYHVLGSFVRFKNFLEKDRFSKRVFSFWS